MTVFDWRRPVLAVQFMTRLPTPQVKDFRPELLAGVAGWFPAVGLLVGGLLVVPVLLLDQEPWLAALLALLGWIWVTGGLHLDGLADLADGLGASHRDPERFLVVLKDPHVGSFGVLALVGQCLSKLVLLAFVIGYDEPWLVVLIPAWARWGVFLWQTLPPLAPGSAGLGERFRWQHALVAWASWSVALVLAALWLAPVLLVAPAVAAAYWLWLRHRLGGVSGDCLGSGIELTESALLLAAAISLTAWGSVGTGWFGLA